jgi:hypothetical protein
MEGRRKRGSYESHGLDVVSIHECDAAANYSHAYLKTAQRVFVEELPGIEDKRLAHLFGLQFIRSVKDFLAQFLIAVNPMVH